MNFLFLNFVIVLWVTVVTTFLLGIFVWSRRRDGLVNRTFALYCFSISWWSFCEIFGIVVDKKSTALFWTRIEQIGVFFIPTFFVHFMFSLLTIKNKQLLIKVTYCFSAITALLSFTPYMIADSVPISAAPYVKRFGTPGFAYHFAILFFVVLTVFGLRELYGAYRVSSGSRRNQLRYLFYSTLIGYIGGGANFLLVYNINVPILNPFGTYALPIYIAVVTYAIARYRLMDINLAITRTTVFTIVYALALGLPLFVALSWQQAFERRLGARWWVWLWVACAFLTTIAHYVNLYFQKRAENRLLQEQRRYQMTLRQAAQGMTLIKEMDRLLNLVVHILTRTVRITHAAAYLLDKEAKVYVLRATRGHQTLEVGHTILAASPLIAELFRQRGAIVQEELKLQLQGGGGPAPLVAAEQGMVAIQAAVLVPSFVEEQLIGFLVLGEKRSGKMYSQDDLQVFEVLASQAALAIENAQFYEELQRTQADLFQTAKMATLGQMAGGMSHQINNRFYVLTILAGTMKAALKGIAPEGVSAALQELIARAVTTFEKIEDNAIRGGDIVKTLLRFSRPSRGDQKAISLQEMIETALDVVQYKIRMDELDFSKELPSNLPLVQGNLNQLADSLFNLFSNAYDAINSKKERLNPTGYRGAIQIKGTAVGGTVELTIHDNGIGMTPQEQSQLFVPFFTTKATSEKGTGLGLFIIKRIVEHHGGQIQVRSIFGEGTTFVITLPAVQSQQAVA